MCKTTLLSTLKIIEEAFTPLNASLNATTIMGVVSFVYEPSEGLGFEATGAAVSMVKDHE